MKTILTILAVSMTTILYSIEKENDSIFIELEKTIANRKFYMEQKENQINNLKALLKQNKNDLEKQYELNLSIYKEYNKYVLDSAIVYTKTNIEIAKQLNNKYIIDESRINLASLYATSGMYIEALELLKSINSSELSPELKADYYDTYSRFYHYYIQSNNMTEYYHYSNLYRDSLLSILDHDSFRYKAAIIEIQVWSRNLNTARKSLTQMLSEVGADSKEKALLSYYMGMSYRLENDYEGQKKYFAMSAISDMKNATKDNASMLILALTLYELGNFERANELIKYAKEDAVFCNSRFRNSELSIVQPAINQAYEMKIKNQNKTLQNNLLLISILSFFLILAVVYVYYQVKRLARTKKALSKSNRELNKVNRQLNNANISLTEANQIKVAYIMQFLDASSNYIENMESYTKRLHSMFTTKKYNELAKALNSTEEIIDHELQELHKNFDNAFLHFYPNFVEKFNSLLIPEERVILKEGELLTPELRIFALIRLGITDTSKIASFLRYSLSTIYNYRNKVRNKSAVPRERFEEFISQIEN